MNSLQQRTRSIWMAARPLATPELAENIETDIVIVGAGIGGLTTAYLLAREGRQVVVVDSGAPGGGMTSRTTAHLTCALDDRWYDLNARRGEDDGRVAADAHRGAIDLIESLVRLENIECDFARVAGYLVPAEAKDADELTKELEAAHKVGLTDVALNDAGPIPAYAERAALRFPMQARFHPLKYLKGIITAITRDGGRIFNAHVTEVKGGADAFVKLASDHTIRARAVVVATNTPINDRVTIHTKMAPYRSYVIAGAVPKNSVPDVLLWDTGWPYHYVRLQPEAERDILIVGGEDHKSGQAEDMTERLEHLETWARKRYPMLDRVTWRWSGQVMESVDYLGYLGRNPGKDDNVFIITGDSGQGMTHCTIGAKIISDEILGRANAWRALFDPGRVTTKAAATYAKENLNVAGQMLDHITGGDVSSVDDIAPGMGAIVREGAHKIAAYRSDDGQLSVHSAVCPHMGCVVAWNPLERCWDCPCHGSQFSAEGEVINGPAISGLSPAEAHADRSKPMHATEGRPSPT